jgi:hypothetical protein
MGAAEDAPKVAATYRERVGRWQLPVLAGIITAPTLRQDGSVLSEPGYDPASGLLLDPCGVAFPPIPEQPDWDAAREAISELLQLIETFPFVADTDRAVAISAILTACLRRWRRRCPSCGPTMWPAAPDRRTRSARSRSGATGSAARCSGWDWRTRSPPWRRSGGWTLRWMR